MRDPRRGLSVTISVWLRCAVLFLFGIGFCAATLPCSASAPTATGSVELALRSECFPDVMGSNIYYGVACGVYNNKISVVGSTSTNATVTGLVQGTTYYFAATAVDALGVESPFSNETTYSVPSNAPPTLDEMPRHEHQRERAIADGEFERDQHRGGEPGANADGDGGVEQPGFDSESGGVSTSPNATGTLAFAPVARHLWTATVTVTLNNGGAFNNLVTQSFMVTVSAVNQPPTFWIR